MDDRHLQFLTAVLGKDGARAVSKATERSTDLATALVPRTVVAWIGTIKTGYEGDLPGLEGSKVRFTKNEHGSYTGAVSIAGQNYEFTNARHEHLAAAISVAIGIDRPRTNLRDVDIEKLGCSLDLLAKTQMLGRELAKAEKVTCSHCHKPTWQRRDGKTGFHHHGDLCPGSGKDPEEDLDKAGMSPGPKPPEPPKAGESNKGFRNTPVAPKGPADKLATAPEVPKQTIIPVKPDVKKPEPTAKPISIKIGKSETVWPCGACGLMQVAGEKLVGCMCIRALLKSIEITAVGPDFQLDLTPLDIDERLLIQEVFQCR